VCRCLLLTAMQFILTCLMQLQTPCVLLQSKFLSRNALQAFRMQQRRCAVVWHVVWHALLRLVRHRHTAGVVNSLALGVFTNHGFTSPAVAHAHNAACCRACCMRQAVGCSIHPCRVRLWYHGLYKSLLEAHAAEAYGRLVQLSCACCVHQPS
jgi:hypothetical protein